MSRLTFIQRLTRVEQINFLLTNRIPRRYATLFIGWFSRIRNPFVCRLSIALWKLFADDLDLGESRKQRFDSLHDCFIRELKPGARTVDADRGLVTSPCDGIVGACGHIDGVELFQAKGFPYTLTELLQDASLAEQYRDGQFVTLRLKSTMYHRFHAPYDGHVDQVNYIAGDTWNVNPIALKRIEKLYCENERVVMTLKPAGCQGSITLIPVAAILVASIRLGFLDYDLDLNYRGANRIPCDVDVHKGEEMGYFQHGSTIIVLASKGINLHESIVSGQTIRMGQALFSCAAATAPGFVKEK